MALGHAWPSVPSMTAAAEAATSALSVPIGRVQVGSGKDHRLALQERAATTVAEQPGDNSDGKGNRLNAFG